MARRKATRKTAVSKNLGDPIPDEAKKNKMAELVQGLAITGFNAKLCGIEYAKANGQSRGVAFGVKEAEEVIESAQIQAEAITKFLLSPRIDRVVNRMDPEALDNIPVQNLEISMRLRMALRQAGVRTLGDFEEATQVELIQTGKLDEKDVTTVIEALKEYGLKIPER